MHIQKHIATKACAFACALAIIISGIGSTTITAHASNTTEVELDRLIDISLTDVGIIANEGTLAYVKECLMGYMVAWGDSYFEYLATNLLEISEDTIRSWLETETFDNAFAEAFCKSDFGVTVLYNIYKPYADNWDSHVITDEELTTAMNLNEAKGGQTYSIPRTFINWIRGIFEDEKENIAGYYFIPTYSPDTVPAKYFVTSTSLDAFKTVLASAGTDVFTVRCYANNASTGFTYKTTVPRYIKDFLGFVDVSADYTATEFEYYFDAYNTSWVEATTYFENNKTTGYGTAFTTLEEYIATTSGVPNYLGISPVKRTGTSTNGYYDFCICTSDGRNLPVFSSLEALKAYDAKQAPYYTTTTYTNYSTSTDNSVTYSGDYMIDYGSTYSYETVNTSNDYSQTNIDNSVTNITNNYTYVNPDYNTPEDDGSGESGDGDDGGLTLGDALNTWVNAIKEFITFAITLLGEAVALISGFLTDALGILSGLTESFTGFTDLLGVMFGFLPEELLDAMSAGIVMIVTLGVIRSFKGG